jgi:hypothetical protein
MILVFDGRWKHYLLGSGVAFTLFVLPVVHLLPDAFHVISTLVSSAGVNANPLAYSFRNLGVALRLDDVASFGMIGSALAAVTSLIVLIAVRDRSGQTLSRQDSGIAILTLAVCTLLVPLGSGYSTYTYSFIILLPGYLVLGLAYERKWMSGGGSTYYALAMFAAILLINALALKLSIRGISSAAIANLAFIPFSFVASLWYFHRMRRSGAGASSQR